MFLPKCNRIKLPLSSSTKTRTFLEWSMVFAFLSLSVLFLEKLSVTRASRLFHHIKFSPSSDSLLPFFGRVLISVFSLFF